MDACRPVGQPFGVGLATLLPDVVQAAPRREESHEPACRSSHDACVRVNRPSRACDGSIARRMAPHNAARPVALASCPSASAFAVERVGRGPSQEHVSLNARLPVRPASIVPGHGGHEDDGDRHRYPQGGRWRRARSTNSAGRSARRRSPTIRPATSRSSPGPARSRQRRRSASRAHPPSGPLSRGRSTTPGSRCGRCRRTSAVLSASARAGRARVTRAMPLRSPG